MAENEKRMALDILHQFAPDCEVRVFGSRQTGQHKPWSDLDMTVVGQAKLDSRRHSEIIDAFQESDLPYRVDVLDWHAIPQRFRDNILKRGYDVLKPAAASSAPSV